MQTMAVIKKDMDFNRGLSSLIEVLKNIAVSQYRSLEHKFGGFDKFMQAVESYFEFIDFAQVQHPFLTPTNKTQAIVMVTSDSGLLGGLNMQVASRALTEMENNPGQLVVVGERGKMYARESGLPFTAYPGINDEQRLLQAFQLRDYLFKNALGGKFGLLKVVYPHPVSFTLQRVESVTFFPFLPDFLSAKQKSTPKSRLMQNVIFESKLSDIVEYLVYLWMGQRLYDIFGLSRLSEFAARYVHLEDSLRRLKEMDKKLKLQYFRVRHEIIDQSMRELFSARLLYNA
ncbi:MAG: FoF1 ATP synthase subunit gamma [Candidatus Omnitrophota bacterium]|nr:FoF1 ATP synthase subunit gamma [Candidatus Omnitrophota bacterium]